MKKKKEKKKKKNILTQGLNLGPIDHQVTAITTMLREPYRT